MKTKMDFALLFLALYAASASAQDCSDDQQKAMQARFSACLNEHTTKHHMATAGAGDASLEERQVRPGIDFL